MAAEKARQLQQLEAFVNQSGVRPCTPNTVLREARVRHGCDVSHLLRATAPPPARAGPLSRRSSRSLQFGAASSAAGGPNSSPAHTGVHASRIAFEGDAEPDAAEELDEADLRMLDAGFAGEGDGWHGDPRQLRRPRLPATITIKTQAPHRFGSVLLAPAPGGPGPRTVAATSLSGSSSSSSSSPPAAVQYASGPKRITFADARGGGAPAAPTASVDAASGCNSSGGSSSLGASRAPRAPSSVVVLMDRVSEDRVAAVLNAGVTAALSPRARTSAAHGYGPGRGHHFGGREPPRGGGGWGNGGGGGGGGASSSSALHPPHSPRSSASVAGMMPSSPCSGVAWTRRPSLECADASLVLSPTPLASGIAGAPAAKRTGSATGGDGGAAQLQHRATGAAAQGAMPQPASAEILSGDFSPITTPCTPRSVVSGRAATASMAMGKRGSAAGSVVSSVCASPPRAVLCGPSGPRPATTCCSSSVSNAAATAAPASSSRSACSSPLLSHLASPLPSACSSPVPAFTVVRRRSIDPQLSIVGGRASRAGSGTFGDSGSSPAAAVTSPARAACSGEASGGSGNKTEHGACDDDGPGGAACRGDVCVGADDELEFKATEVPAMTATSSGAEIAAPTTAAGSSCRSAPLPHIITRPTDAYLQQHLQNWQHSHPPHQPLPFRPQSRAATLNVLPLSSDDYLGGHHEAASSAAVPAGRPHLQPHTTPQVHGHGLIRACLDTLPDRSATGASGAQLSTASAPQIESLPSLRLSSLGSGSGPAQVGGTVAGRLGELSSSGGDSGGEFARAAARARRNSAPYPASCTCGSGGGGNCSANTPTGRVSSSSSSSSSSSGYTSPAPSHWPSGTDGVHAMVWENVAAVGGAASGRTSPAPTSLLVNKLQPHHHPHPDSQMQRRRPSDHDDGGDVSASSGVCHNHQKQQQPQQRRSQSGAGGQQVHVIGPVASLAVAAATEAAAVSRMTRVMRAESRKGPADQDWTLEPEAVAEHAARVLGAASAHEVAAAAASTAAFGRGHCVRLHGHAHEPASASAPALAPLMSSGDGDGGANTDHGGMALVGAEATGGPSEEAQQRSSHSSGEGAAEATTTNKATAAEVQGLSAGPPPGPWPHVGSSPHLAAIGVAAAAGPAGRRPAVPRLPQPQHLPFLPGVSRLKSKLTFGSSAPHDMPSALSGSGAHSCPLGPWTASAAATSAAAGAAAAPVTSRGNGFRQQQAASSRPVTSGPRFAGTAATPGASPPPSPPQLPPADASRPHKRAATATAATAACHTLPTDRTGGKERPAGGYGTRQAAGGSQTTCRGEMVRKRADGSGDELLLQSGCQGVAAVDGAAAATPVPSFEMAPEERAGILLRIKNALSFLHRDE